MTKSTNRRRSVRFSSEPDSITSCPSRSDINFEDVWYSKDEYDLIKKSFRFIVRMMDRKEPLDANDEEMCSRGLETRTRSGAKRRQWAIDASLDAVFQEQECQWEEGHFSPRALAAAYREVSAESSMKAYIDAQRDAKAVIGEKQAMMKKMQSLCTPYHPSGTKRVSNCTAKLHRQSSQSSIRSK